MKTFLVALLFTVFSAAAGAHSELPAETWCEGGRLVPVMTITVPAHTLKLRGEHCRSRPPVPQLKECGQFDDDYDLTKSVAMGICAALGFGGTEGGDIGSVIFMADWPSTFLDPAHHELFDAEQGLSGTCVRCEAVRRVVPSPD